MTYTIEETDLERQHLLAEFLNPVSLNALKNISLPEHASILDIGCGLGDTTLMLNERFPNSTITGLDGDASLIENATQEKTLLHPNLNFVCADALHLPFDDNSFDFVFCRFVLTHIPDAFAVMKEMKRVCKAGGIVFAHETAVIIFQSYPETAAYNRLKDVMTSLFANAGFGRKLIHHFKELEFKEIEHDAQGVLGDHPSILKRFFSMTAVAMRNAIIEKKLMTDDEVAAWIRELKRIEHDENFIIIPFLLIAVWGIKDELSFEPALIIE